MLKVADRDSHRGRHLAGGLTLQASYYSRGFPYTVFSRSFISSKPVLSGTYTRRHGTRRPLLRVASLRWGGIAEPHCLQQEISRDAVGDNTEQHGDGDHRHHRIVAGQLGIEDDDGEYDAGKSARPEPAHEQLFGHTHPGAGQAEIYRNHPDD